MAFGIYQEERQGALLSSAPLHGVNKIDILEMACHWAAQFLIKIKSIFDKNPSIHTKHRYREKKAIKEQWQIWLGDDINLICVAMWTNQHSEMCPFSACPSAVAEFTLHGIVIANESINNPLIVSHICLAASMSAINRPNCPSLTYSSQSSRARNGEWRNPWFWTLQLHLLTLKQRE